MTASTTPPPWTSSSRVPVPLQLTIYFLGCFVIPWGVAALLLAEPRFVVERFGPVDMQAPTYAIVFYVVVWVPSILGFVLTGVFEGRAGLAELWTRLLKWRVGWWLPGVMLGIPLFYAITDWVLYGLFGYSAGEPSYQHHLYGWLVVGVTGAILTDPGPLGEEVGWRGFATPRLLQVLRFRHGELLLGSIWGFWHLPAFYLAGTSQSGFNMAGFMIGAVCLSFLMGAVYVGTGGSVLLAGFAIHYFANQLPDLSGKIWIEVLRFLILAIVCAQLAARSKYRIRHGS